MKPGYTVRAKLEGAGVGDPVNQGQVKGKRGLDIDVIDENGVELDSERVISEGLAWKAKGEILNASGEVVAKWEGIGASNARFPAGPAEGKAIPLPGYTLDGPIGSSALEHSNGFRGVINFKQLEDGIFTARASVDGVPAKFVGGNTVGFGKAEKRKADAGKRGHED